MPSVAVRTSRSSLLGRRLLRRSLNKRGLGVGGEVDGRKAFAEGGDDGADGLVAGDGDDLALEIAEARRGLQESEDVRPVDVAMAGAAVFVLLTVIVVEVAVYDIGSIFSRALSSQGTVAKPESAQPFWALDSS